MDDPKKLREILEALAGAPLPVVFPVHPRTRDAARDTGMENLLGKAGAIQLLGYLDFLSLQMHAAVVRIDSGGVQEDTMALGVACLTFRDEPERTVSNDRAGH